MINNLTPEERTFLADLLIEGSLKDYQFERNESGQTMVTFNFTVFDMDDDKMKILNTILNKR